MPFSNAKVCCADIKYEKYEQKLYDTLWLKVCIMYVPTHIMSN